MVTLLYTTKMNMVSNLSENVHTPTLLKQGHESYQSHRQFGTMTVAFSL